MTSNRAIKLNFSKNIRTDFIRMSNLILDYVRKIIPNNQTLLAFAIHNYDDGTEETFKACLVDDCPIYERFDNLSWTDLETNIPDLKDFIDKYSLGRSFTIADGSEVPPHRHYYTWDSMWSISIFRGKSPGIIKFFRDKNRSKTEDNSVNLGKLEDFICEEEIRTLPGDFYSLDTWSWHGWLADDHSCKSFCLIFYMKDTNSYSSTIKAIEKIENS